MTIEDWLLDSDPAIRGQARRDVVESKGGADGRWPLEILHDDDLQFEMGEAKGKPSRWITLRALRVLRWASAGDA